MKHKQTASLRNSDKIKSWLSDICLLSRCIRSLTFRHFVINNFFGIWLITRLKTLQAIAKIIAHLSVRDLSEGACNKKWNIIDCCLPYSNCNHYGYWVILHGTTSACVRRPQNDRANQGFYLAYKCSFLLWKTRLFPYNFSFEICTMLSYWLQNKRFVLCTLSFDTLMIADWIYTQLSFL